LQEKAKEKKRIDKTEAHDAKALEDLLSLGDNKGGTRASGATEDMPVQQPTLHNTTPPQPHAATPAPSGQEGGEDLEAWLDSVI